MLGFRSLKAAEIILSGVELIHMMRKRQARFAVNPNPSLAEQFDMLAARVDCVRPVGAEPISARHLNRMRLSGGQSCALQCFRYADFPDETTSRLGRLASLDCMSKLDGWVCFELLVKPLQIGIVTAVDHAVIIGPPGDPDCGGGRCLSAGAKLPESLGRT